MSKRRHPGETVWKAAGAGYYQNAGYGRIAPTAANARCTQCEDPNCREWPVLLRLIDQQGASVGVGWYYISECEMQDADQVPEGASESHMRRACAA